QHLEFEFDDIGNRTSTKGGGDDAGAALRAATYSVNNLNQYTSRDFPGTNDIIGIANANATVTVNGLSTYRRGEYYQKTVSGNNSSTALVFGVTNKAILSGTTNQTNAFLFITNTHKNLAYDLQINK